MLLDAVPLTDAAVPSPWRAPASRSAPATAWTGTTSRRSPTSPPRGRTTTAPPGHARRGTGLAFWYCTGHGLVLFVFGMLVLALGIGLPAGPGRRLQLRRRHHPGRPRRGRAVPARARPGRLPLRRPDQPGRRRAAPRLGPGPPAGGARDRPATSTAAARSSSGCCTAPAPRRPRRSCCSRPPAPPAPGRRPPSCCSPSSPAWSSPTSASPSPGCPACSARAARPACRSALGAVTGVASLTLGALILTGHSDVVPPLVEPVTRAGRRCCGARSPPSGPPTSRPRSPRRATARPGSPSRRARSGVLEELSVRLAGLAGTCPPPLPDARHGRRVRRRPRRPRPGRHPVAAGGHRCRWWPTSSAAAPPSTRFAGQVGRRGRGGRRRRRRSAGRPAPGLLARKVRAGTRDLAVEPAMTREEAVAGRSRSASRSPASWSPPAPAACSPATWASPTPPPPRRSSPRSPAASPPTVTGRGTGIDDATLARKTAVVRAALARHAPDPADPVGVLAAVGGLEHAALAGFVLGAAAPRRARRARRRHRRRRGPGRRRARPRRRRRLRRRPPLRRARRRRRAGRARAAAARRPRPAARRGHRRGARAAARAGRRSRRWRRWRPSTARASPTRADLCARATAPARAGPGSSPCRPPSALIMGSWRSFPACRPARAHGHAVVVRPVVTPTGSLASRRSGAVGDLAAEVGWSARHLTARFRVEIGPVAQGGRAGGPLRPGPAPARRPGAGGSPTLAAARVRRPGAPGAGVPGAGRLPAERWLADEFRFRPSRAARAAARISHDRMTTPPSQRLADAAGARRPRPDPVPRRRVRLRGDRRVRRGRPRRPRPARLAARRRHHARLGRRAARTTRGRCSPARSAPTSSPTTPTACTPRAAAAAPRSSARRVDTDYGSRDVRLPRPGGQPLVVRHLPGRAPPSGGGAAPA